jgi:prolyl 4-hydroxylase
MYFGHFDFSKPLVWEVPQLFTPDECHLLIEHHKDDPWLAATVNSMDGRVVDERIRNNSLAIVRDSLLADQLFQRIRSHVPAQMSVETKDGGRQLVTLKGIFTPVRIYRYHAGQSFGLHRDQGYEDNEGARSLLTLMVYLNHDFEGGRTTFPELEREVVPQTGNALIFQHMVLHKGEKVIRGTKYVVRSDILYRAQEEVHQNI